MEAYQAGEISKAKLREIASELEIPNEKLWAFVGGIEVETESATKGVRIQVVGGLIW